MAESSRIEASNPKRSIRNKLTGRAGKTVIAVLAAGTAGGGLIAATSHGGKATTQHEATTPSYKSDKANSGSTTTTEAPTEFTTTTTTTTTTQKSQAMPYNAAADMCDNSALTGVAQNVLGSDNITCAHGYTPFAEGVDAYGAHWDVNPLDATDEVGVQLFSYAPGLKDKFDPKNFKGEQTTVNGNLCELDNQNQFVCFLGDKGIAEVTLPTAQGQNNSLEANKAFMEAVLTAASK
jgi:hypothetical protein